MSPVVEAYAELAARILRRPARLGPTRLVAVDGPSGAGKTVFASRLAAALDAAPALDDTLRSADGPSTNPADGRNPPPDGRNPPADGPKTPADGPKTPADGPKTPVVHTDDLLDGWADQFTFWPRLEEWILAPLRAGRPARYRRYDWTRGRFGPDWTVVPPAPVVIVEGVSSARAVIAAELSLAVFVTAPARLCRDRTLARDGAALAPRLTVWRRGERAHFAADRTAERADLVVDGAAGPALDAAAFVRVR
ncbi:hypothetical protein C6361_30795 [Plantactinospora sp. BC1]|uniref:uridine kinase family protein n=1 Tax=Plantactinospora sp. BC1 TaxID=2108470 RepID=UPI000D16FE46|nr:hypothetical protein [Plantactinospora sp. BC1]AVT33108.1 hypothetical protein C6361_30795 [Plantactinospora sp. BC1]